MAILIRISAVLIPSMEKVAPNYLKLSTSGSFSPFIWMSALVLVVLFSMILDLFGLTSTPYAPAR
ncbi:hypothetical protein DPMN_042883 [Dreissena polymorpha]|uniref:Uncharacterized protein n=1 Tax=Dreissena polymorpha TaxID=45954 RepID=A0A9D4D0C6_DREPO|nr:hypothetical protein DPMN_042883 [Dreissena polymorpha]